MSASRTSSRATWTHGQRITGIGSVPAKDFRRGTDSFLKWSFILATEALRPMAAMSRMAAEMRKPLWRKGCGRLAGAVGSVMLVMSWFICPPRVFVWVLGELMVWAGEIVCEWCRRGD